MASYFGELVETIVARGQALLARAGWSGGRAGQGGDLPLLAAALLSRRGEATGVAIAGEILSALETATAAQRADFLRQLATDLGADQERLRAAVDAWTAKPGALTEIALHRAAEPRRQEFLRRLNLAPGGTAALVRLRAELLDWLAGDPALAAVDADFAHLFGSWFNRGFLVLRRIDWSTPANVLEKVISYEAVHAIDGWDDLRNRLAPPDRRCFAFFHPQLGDEPLIFVQVALTAEIPSAIAPLLDLARVPVPPDRAACAVFYSISNCQRGLRGISLGSFLIKQVAEELKRELPHIGTFVTLSPMPGFGSWLAAADGPALGDEDRVLAASLVAESPDAERDPALLVDPRLERLAARYLLGAKGANGRPLDAVARFHLGNGASVHRIHLGADISAKGLGEAHGVMVNYLYELDSIEANHEAFAEKGEVVADAAIRKLLAGPRRRPAASA